MCSWTKCLCENKNTAGLKTHLMQKTTTNSCFFIFKFLFLLFHYLFFSCRAVEIIFFFKLTQMSYCSGYSTFETLPARNEQSRKCCLLKKY